MKKMEAKLLAVVLLLCFVFSMNASAEGDDIVIESDMTWSDDMSLSQNEGVEWRVPELGRLTLEC